MRALSRLRDGLVGAWCPSVSGWGGNVLRDLSGMNNHGQLVNMDPATDWVVSEGKQALDFDGSNDDVTFPTIPMSLFSRGLTVTAHVKWNSYNVASTGVIAKWEGAAAAQRSFTLAVTGTGLVNFAVSNTGLFVASNSVVTSAAIGTVSPAFVAGVWLPSRSISVIRDREVVTGTSSIPSSLFESPLPVRLGVQFFYGNSTYYANATFFDVRLYNKPLEIGELDAIRLGGPGIGLRPERKRRPPRVQVAPPPPPVSNKIGTTKRRNKDRLRDGLVGAWCPSVSGWGGNVLRDLSGRNNHGQLVNMDPATDWVVSGGKQALDFDGVDDYVKLSNTTVPGLYTVAFWVSSGALVGVQNNGLFRNNNTGLWLKTTTGRYWGRHNSIDIESDFSGPIAKIGKLDFLVRTWDGTTAKLFFDGVVYSSVSATTTTAWTLDVIGRQFSEFWKGQILDVRLFSRALSDQEVRTLYNGGPGYGLRPERKRRYVQGQTFTAARLRRQSLIGSGVY